METYVVRIYRRNRKRSDKIDGMVEKVGIKDPYVFHDMDELSRIISTPPQKKGKRKRPIKPDDAIEFIDS